MPSQIDGRKVGFVGAGAMAEALARGFLDKKVIEAGDIWSCDPSKARMDVFAEFGCSNVKNAAEVRPSRMCYSIVGAPTLRRRQSSVMQTLFTFVTTYVPPQIAQQVDVIFISVKPQYVGVVIREMKPHLTNKHILVSIAAGIPLSVMKVKLVEDEPCCTRGA